MRCAARRPRIGVFCTIICAPTKRAVRDEFVPAAVAHPATCCRSSSTTTTSRRRAGEPTLLSLDDALTLFHEFGHGCTPAVAGDLRKPVGHEVLRDFVELPSQIFENWLLEPMCCGGMRVMSRPAHRCPTS